MRIVWKLGTCSSAEKANKKLPRGITVNGNDLVILSRYKINKDLMVLAESV